MDSLLFLAHRLPFPPNKGDKVRSYHFFRHLAGRYRVFLGTFIDDPADWEHLESVQGHCAGMHVEALTPWTKRARSAAGLLTGEPMTLPCFRSARLHRWVMEVADRERISCAFAFSSPMAQYILDLPRVRSFVDFVDMDSAKWGEYARRRPWPISALYNREAARLLRLPLRMKPLTLESARLVARRPRYCALSPAKLAAAGVDMPTWQDALGRYLSEPKA